MQKMSGSHLPYHRAIVSTVSRSGDRIDSPGRAERYEGAVRGVRQVDQKFGDVSRSNHAAPSDILWLSLRDQGKGVSGIPRIVSSPFRTAVPNIVKKHDNMPGVRTSRNKSILKTPGRNLLLVYTRTEKDTPYRRWGNRRNECH